MTNFRHFSLLLSILSFVSLCVANGVPPENICNSTINPTYCKTMFANQNGTIYDYGRISIQKSLSQSRNFVNLLNSHLQRSSSLSKFTVRALEDCRELADLSFEYLSNTYSTTNRSSNVLQISQAEDYETFLSAVLTNQQTCLEGLDAISASSDLKVKNELSLSLSDQMKLHSVTLALFLKGWKPEYKIRTSWPQKGRHLNFKNGRLPLKMSEKTRAIYDSARRHGRKLLKSGEDDEESILVSDIVVVSKDKKSGNFVTINDAIAAAPNNSVASDGYFLIFVTQGVYEEYVNIDKKKKYLMMVGEGINQTIITGNRSVGDGFTTFNSATFVVTAEGFVGVNMTIRNTAGPSKHQAVALRSGADMSIFYSCSFEAYQDTLYTHSLRQYYRECDIYGTVDFIFGNAATVLQNCNIYPRLPLSGQFNPITAQGRTDPNQNTGISIQNANIKPADDLAPNVGTVKTYLGRPWKEYSRTIYMQCFMDSFIDPFGWREWNGDFALNTLYYAEYDNRGPGSSTVNRVTWPGYHVINATDAANFTVSNFISGDVWIPQSGVPYMSGLI